jgi:hypothetical protein
MFNTSSFSIYIYRFIWSNNSCFRGRIPFTCTNIWTRLVSIKIILWNKFLVFAGDIAAIYQQGHSIDDQPSLAHGLIFRFTANTIHITIEDNDDEQFNSLGDTCSFMIIKMANDVTYRRLKQYVKLNRDCTVSY